MTIGRTILAAYCNSDVRRGCGFTGFPAAQLGGPAQITVSAGPTETPARLRQSFRDHKMEHNSKLATKKLRTVNNGLSILELLLVLAVSSILLATATPSFLQAYRGYQMKDAVTRVAGVLRLTRFEAIRRNTPVNCLIQGTANSSSIWTDSNGDGIEQPTENQTLLSGGINLSSAGTVPNPAGLAAAVGVGALTVLSPTDATTVAFDGRGAVNPPAVYVLYLCNVSIPSAGYRAVILLPSGSIQTWSSDSSGQWRRYN
jgi:type IV fimbrial biogenesis protein FimT